MFDDFANEQSVPLDSLTASSSSFASNAASSILEVSQHILGLSSPQHSAVSSSYHSSMSNNGRLGGGFSHHSRSGRDLSQHSSSLSQMLTLTALELEDLQRFVRKMEKLWEIYSAAHYFDSSFSCSSGAPTPARPLASLLDQRSSSQDHPSLPVPVSSPRHSSTVSSTSLARRLANEELRNCYSEVPDLFFRSDFSLSNQEIFQQALFIFDVSQGTNLSRSHSDDPQHNVNNSGSSVGSFNLLQQQQQRRADSSSSSSSGRSSSSLSPHNPIASRTLPTTPRTPQQLPQFRDNLSHYLDCVEIALLRQIWYRCPAFFRSLDNFKGLQYEVHEAVQLLLIIRRKLSFLQEKQIKKSLRIPQLLRKQRNYRSLQEKLDAMKSLLETRKTVLALLECEDYYSAQEAIYSIKDIYRLASLREIGSMKEINDEMKEYSLIIGNVLCNKFASIGIGWEDSSTSSSANSSGSLQPQSSSSSAAFAYIEELDQIAAVTPSSSLQHQQKGKQLSLILEQKNETKKLISSLLASEQFHLALNLYRNRLTEGIKLIIRTCLMEYMTGIGDSNDPFSLDGSFSLENPDSSSSSLNFSDPVPGGGGGGDGSDISFAQRIREMSLESFLSCLSMCFEHLTLSLQKAYLFHQFISESLSSLLQSQQQQQKGEDAGHGMAQEEHPIRLKRGDRSLSLLLESGFSAGRDTPDDSSPSYRGSVASTASSGQQLLYSSLSRVHQAIIEEYLTISKSSLVAACEIVQKSIIQLFNFRKEINAKASNLDKMIFLWEISLQFLKEIELYSGGSNAYPFRQCLLLQTKLFLENLHESSKTRLVNTLDNERWNQCDCSSDRQAEINRLVSGKAFLLWSASSSSSSSTFSSSRSSKGNDFAIEGGSQKSIKDGQDTVNGNNNSSLSVLSSSEKKGKPSSSNRDKDVHPVIIEGISSTPSSASSAPSSSSPHQEYKVVWSVLLLIEMILSYLEISFHFPDVTHELINKIIDLIRLFNNRTKQLVLGAQAIQSTAKLKSISAKHLAITGQSLGLFLYLLPHIRTALLCQIKQQRATSILSVEFDRINSELFDHHGQIMSKFVNIVSDMIEATASSTKLKTIDWDKGTISGGGGGSGDGGRGPVSSSNQQQLDMQQCEYFEEIQRNIITLHKVLINILPHEQITDIFTRICALLNRKLLSHFDDLAQQPITMTGKQRILDELQYFISSLSRLKAVDSTILTTQLEETLRRKYGNQQK
jgi:vacuolar protein sorting-associated protein 54